MRDTVGYLEVGNIYKIKPGLYALTKFKSKFESDGILSEDAKEKDTDKYYMDDEGMSNGTKTK